MIPKRLPMKQRLSDEELDTLAEISDGFSGREIRKAMLTTLAEGATKGVTEFTIEEFKAGFSSVRSETMAVNEEAKVEIEGSLITDFINQNK